MEENITNDNDNNYDVEINSFDGEMMFNFDNLFNYYTKEQLIEYVTNPMVYHKQLMDVCEKMYNRNGILGQTISKMVSAPSLDSVIIPRTSKKLKGKSKNNYDKAYKIMNNKINHRLSTRDCAFNSLLYGEYIAILRDTKKKKVERPKEYAVGKNIEGVAYIDNVMLQPLDLRYCRFEGFANGDYVCSFDLQYFDMFQGSGLVGEIKNYPKEFLIGYNAYKKDASKRWLLLPQKTTFAYKYRGAINEIHGRPLGMFALLDILFAEDYTDSQRNNMYDNSSTIRWMRLPEGEKKGSCSLNKEQQNNQYSAFKNAVKRNDNNRQNKIGGTTTLKLAPNTEIGKLDSDNTFLKDTLTNENNTNISTSLGFPIAVLNGGNSGTNFSTLSISMDLMLAEVFSMLEQISFQYTKLLNNYLNVSDDNGFDFVYLNTSTINADKQFGRFKELYTLAGGSRLYLYSCACGNSDLYTKLMDFEKAEGFDERYMPHQTSYTLTDSADKVNPDGNTGVNHKDDGKKKEQGGQTKEDVDLTPRGEQTRNNGGNDMPSPSDNK